LNVFIGDFNIDVSKNSFYSSKLLENLSFFGLKQIVKDFTRIDGASKSIIDLVFTNEMSITTSVSSYDNISDHNSIYINSTSQTEKPVAREKTSWKNYTKEKLCDNLKSSAIWAEIEKLELEEKAEKFEVHIKQSVNCLLEKKCVIMRSGLEVFSEELLNLKNDKIRLYEIASLSDDQEKWKCYNQARNKYCKSLNARVDQSIKEKIEEAENDPQKTWKVLKTVIKKGQSATPNVIKFQNELVSDKSAIANKFNDYFVNSIKEINESIDEQTNYQLTLSNVNSKFKLKRLTRDQIWIILKNIKTKTGVENINTQVVKDSFAVIGEVLTSIVNESIETGKVPKVFKISTVVPIQKVARTMNCSEFRPINMLPVYEKICEIAIKNPTCRVH
jgi:hypothetical protein